MIEFEELQNQAQKDLTFNIHEVENFALNIANLKEKYLRYLRLYRLELKKQEFNVDKVYADRHEYHSLHNPRTLHRNDLDTYIKADSTYRKAIAEYTLIDEQVKYIDGVIKSIDNMTFAINSAVKLHIFKNGG